MYFGDANLDYSVNVNDATVIQKHLANAEKLSAKGEFFADANQDGDVTVKDATMVQKYCASIITNLNKYWDYVPTIKAFYSNCDSGKAYPGMPVDFTIVPEGGIEPFSYEIFINDLNNDFLETAHFNTDEPKWTYTFDKSGDYYITIIIYNAFGDSLEYNNSFSVIELEDSILRIKSLKLNKYSPDFGWYKVSAYDKKLTADAQAEFGSEDYEYRFELSRDSSIKNEPELDFDPYGDYVFDESIYSGSYSKSGVFNFKDMLSPGVYKLKVSVKDSTGNTAEDEMKIFSDYMAG